MKSIFDSVLPTHAELLAQAQSLVLLQIQVGQWAKQTFPHQTIESKAEHLKHEAQEIINKPDDRVETADCLILLINIAALQGMNIEALLEEAWRKFEICKARKWGAPDANGVCHHIEENEPTTK